jgi:hypothetical protein
MILSFMKLHITFTMEQALGYQRGKVKVREYSPAPHPSATQSVPIPVLVKIFLRISMVPHQHKSLTNFLLFSIKLVVKQF